MSEPFRLPSALNALPRRAVDVQACPYRGLRSGPLYGNEGDVRVFLLVHREPTAHGLTYLFLSGAPIVERVGQFVAENSAQFGDDVAVVELAKAYANETAAMAEMHRLKITAPHAQVMGVWELEDC